MKASIIVSVISAAVFVAAQTPDLSQLPSCALPCAMAGISSTGCQSSDYSCICKNEKFIGSVQICLPTSCKDRDDIQKTIKFAVALCGSDLPSAVLSSINAGATSSGNTMSGNATSGSGSGNATSTSGGASGTTPKPSYSASSTSSPNSAAGLVPGGFAVAAIFAGLLAL
ncbi:hypothetical protein L873DRAFT_1820475 [Choiromyces venosus 120613-1]|uniref:CFEM domain-containing protein n=1 Tax=Choiromyces venosus 120613-1 TaxID=1336337 RepID=A0A3N4JAC5_9PEZI|nr:hypothetical protein L873DRAFT_1820475 [Choiromyces venosus 120613-1]